MKHLVICEAHKRAGLTYNGHKIRFFGKDYCHEMMKQRAKFKGAMSGLYKWGFRPVLLYPAKLRITLLTGERKWPQSALNADTFVQDLCTD